MGQQPAAESPKSCLYLVPVGVLVFFFCSFDASPGRSLLWVESLPTVGLSSPYAHHLLSEPYDALVANGVRLVNALIVHGIIVLDEALDSGHCVVEGMRSCVRNSHKSMCCQALPSLSAYEQNVRFVLVSNVF